MAENQEIPLIDPSILTKDKPVTPNAQPVKNKKPDQGGFIWGTGRRKSSVARVRIKPGTGKLVINSREFEAYFTRPQDINAIKAPLKAAEAENSFDIFVNVKGGGTTGQSGAVRLGIARAMVNYDQTLIEKLRDGGFLTRDGRMVERKKPGKPGARKSFQFSKR